MTNRRGNTVDTVANDAEQAIGITEGVLNRAEAELKKVRECCQQVCDQARERVAEMQEKTVGDVMADFTKTIRENPGKSLAIAGLVGFLLGRFLRR